MSTSLHLDPQCAKRACLIGSFLPANTTDLSPAGQYVQVYVNAGIDASGHANGQTSVGGLNAHVWGSVDDDDVSAYINAADGPSDTLSVSTAVFWHDRLAESLLIFERDNAKQPWFVTFIVIQDGAEVVNTGRSPYKSGTWLVKK